VTSKSLRGTLAVVTGGASGIGYALANAYGQRGASVLIADRDEPALKTAHASLTDAGIETDTHLVDLCDEQPTATPTTSRARTSSNSTEPTCATRWRSGRDHTLVRADRWPESRAA
jgi:NAD(P)-dependent dehydrogenase (short-subunit alcohol dehydrogenase family)